jgi:hypothetical protein
MKALAQPFDQKAYDATNKEFHSRHPELGGRELTMLPQDTLLRLEWRRCYRKHYRIEWTKQKPTTPWIPTPLAIDLFKGKSAGGASPKFSLFGSPKNPTVQPPRLNKELSQVYHSTGGRCVYCDKQLYFGAHKATGAAGAWDIAAKGPACLICAAKMARLG